ncbi:MAG TPA: CFI-box-CTERM domain-containing protein [Candidatus Angelobacter sp.]|nr:CFI-box-CTERM domain-containing protein [Candidatus Angelobacter sp.]
MTPEKRENIKMLFSATLQAAGGISQNAVANIDALAQQIAAIQGEDPSEVRVILLEAIHERRSGGVSSSSKGNSSTGKCFIATACYGDPDCREVLTLRRFRDERLLPKAAGRRMVELYCRFGPSLAATMENSPLLRAFVRSLFIRPLVAMVDRSLNRNENRENRVPKSHAL